MTARTIRRLRTGWQGYGRWLAAAAVGFAALQFVTAGAVSGAPGDVIGYPVPSRDSNLSGITTGPDRNLWFTEYSTQVIGRITPAGQIPEFSDGITPGSGPAWITVGPDGNLWFSEQTGNRIGRITPT